MSTGYINYQFSVFMQLAFAVLLCIKFNDIYTVMQ